MRIDGLGSRFVADFTEYTDPRLVALYDALCARRRDTDFYLWLAAQLSASSVVDIGCGTGSLACELAARGHEVTGVDPSPAMIAFARRRPGSEPVTWVEGDAGALQEGRADLAVMTGHVAQIISDEQRWARTLAATYRALRPGGYVAFESRNPDAGTWTAWGRGQAASRHIHHAELGEFEVWHELLDLQDSQVRFAIHYRLVPTGEEMLSTGELRFRTQAELERSLTVSGFVVQEVFGDWDRRPVSPESPELIFVAASCPAARRDTSLAPGDR